MIESPVFHRVVARVRQDAVLSVLSDRFGQIPEKLADRVRLIDDDARLRKLLTSAARSADIKEFTDELDRIG